MNVEHLKDAFEILLFGWLGVFFVLFILYLVSLALLKLFPPKNQGE